MVLRAWRDGLGRVMGAPAIVAGVFVVTLAAALPLAMSMRGAIQNHLGSSVMANVSGVLNAVLVPLVYGGAVLLARFVPERSR